MPVYGLTVDSKGRPAYAMRFIEGTTLHDAIAEFHKSAAGGSEQQLAFRKLIGQLITVCYTLDFAHSQNVIHRDLKPENIMLGSHNETLVVDWGIAKKLNDSESNPYEVPIHPADSFDALSPRDSGTKQGSAIGTPGFMSPEQALGWNDALTARSDIYSLGVILYTILTGKSPFADAASFEEFQNQQPLLDKQ